MNKSKLSENYNKFIEYVLTISRVNRSTDPHDQLKLKPLYIGYQKEDFFIMYTDKSNVLREMKLYKIKDGIIEYAGSMTGFKEHFRNGGIYYDEFSKFTLEKLPTDSEFYIYVGIPETGELLPLHIEHKETTVQSVEQLLRNMGKPSELAYYSGIHQVLDPGAKIIDFLPDRQNQVIFWAKDNNDGSEFPTVTEQMDDQILAIVFDHPRPHIFLLKKTDDISKIVNYIRQINSNLDLYKYYEGKREKVEIGSVASHLPRRTYQIAFRVDLKQRQPFPVPSQLKYGFRET